MTLQSIVNTAFHTGLLTTWQNRQMVTLIQQGPCSRADLEAVDALIEAVIEGRVAVEPDPRFWDEEAVSLRFA